MADKMADTAAAKMSDRKKGKMKQWSEAKEKAIAAAAIAYITYYDYDIETINFYTGTAIRRAP